MKQSRCCASAVAERMLPCGGQQLVLFESVSNHAGTIGVGWAGLLLCSHFVLLHFISINTCTVRQMILVLLMAGGVVKHLLTYCCSWVALSLLRLTAGAWRPEVF